MTEVEDVGHNLPDLISAVAEKNTELTEAERARVDMKWRFQLVVALVREIVAAARVEPAKLQEQEAGMREEHWCW